MNIDTEGIVNWPAYGIAQKEKEERFCSVMKELTEYHRLHCAEYGKILEILGYNREKVRKTADIPMIPVSLFKKFSLASIEEKEIFKIVTSSGTTGQTTSKVILDSRTAALQQKVLYQIISSFIGTDRLPMLIFDCPSVLRDRAMFSARGAGILGFSIFSTERCFALDDDMKLDVPRIKAFLEKHKGKRILVFGFTYMIWANVCNVLRAAGERLDIGNGYLIHGGGWKKLKDQAVSAEQFAEEVKSTCGIPKISSYYGMAEQTGTIYVECEYGHLHASSYSEIIFRNMRDFSVCECGQEGAVQVMSPIAGSYPGHSLLTEDKGILLGSDDCPCGRKGKYFHITGRMERAEIRGCSDVYGGTV